MPKYIIAYRGGSKPKTKEEGAAGMAKWQAWLGDLGDAVINPGTPLGASKTITPDSVSDTISVQAMTGYTVVNAEDMDAALAMAKGCPFLDMDNASLEVAQMMEMNPAG